MENNEMMNEVITTEAMEEITTQAASPSNGNGLKNLAIIGGIMTLGAVAWEFAVKPVGRKVKASIHKARAKKNVNQHPQEEPQDVMDFELDEIEPIEEE